MSRSNKNSKQTKKPKGAGGTALMQQMGFSIPNFDDPNFGAGGDDDDDDDDLTAELERMQQGAGGPANKRSKTSQKKSNGAPPNLESFHQDVNKLLSDIDRPINEDDLSDGDEAGLLDELKELAGDIEDEQENEPVETKPAQPTSSGGIVSVLETRLGMYKKVIETTKANGEASKARRYDRQFKLIQEMLQTARAGKPINESEIPPAIGVAATPSAQPTSAPQQPSARSPSPPPVRQPAAAPLQNSADSIVSEPSTSVSASKPSDEAIAQLKFLALQARAEGDMSKAGEYFRQMKSLQQAATSVSAPPPQPSLPASAQAETPTNAPEEEDSAAPAMPLLAPVPRTVLEALQQRHEELKKRHQEAASKGESSKARRLDRMTKQYQEAIEATRKGRPYDYSELAELVGFAPIPVQQPKVQLLPPPPSSSSAAAPVGTSQSTTQTRPTQSQPQQLMPTNGSLPQLATTTATDTIADQTAHLKQLALQAKRRGDDETAKKYILEYKRLEQATASAEYIPPSDTNQASDVAVDGFDTIRDDDLTKEIGQSSRETLYHRLREDLVQQMLLCARNQQMYAQMEGANNLIRAKEFKNLEQRCAHDLERLKQCFQHGSKSPVFHYEKRQMNIIQVNNDLTDNDLEVTVLRGINLQVPTGYSPTALETYVIIECPCPPDASQTARTRHTTGSTNAEYSDPPHKFQIKRNDKQFKRSLLRRELKLSIFYRAGLFRADRQLGFAFIKLAGLDQFAIIHESTDIYENDHKKKPHGKLEVKIRIKEALGPNKSPELLPQRWLVIDRFEEIPANSKPSTTKSLSTTSSIAAIASLIPTSEALGLLALNLAGTNTNKILDSSKPNVVESTHDNRRDIPQQTGPQSIQVLKYEADLLEEQIEQLEEHLSKDQLAQLRAKHQALKEQRERIIENLRQGGKQAFQEHAKGLEQLIERYTREEDDYRQRDEKKKADLSLHKKTLVAKEIETLIGPT